METMTKGQNFCLNQNVSLKAEKKNHLFAASLLLRAAFSLTFLLLSSSPIAR